MVLIPETAGATVSVQLQNPEFVVIRNGVDCEVSSFNSLGSEVMMKQQLLQP